MKYSWSEMYMYYLTSNHKSVKDFILENKSRFGIVDVTTYVMQKMEGRQAKKKDFENKIKEKVIQQYENDMTQEYKVVRTGLWEKHSQVLNLMSIGIDQMATADLVNCNALVTYRKILRTELGMPYKYSKIQPVTDESYDDLPQDVIDNLDRAIEFRNQFVSDSFKINASYQKYQKPENNDFNKNDNEDQNDGNQHS